MQDWIVFALQYAFNIADGNEVSLLVCQYWMPARFAKVVQLTLHQESLRTMQADQEEASRTAYLCNLDDNGANCDEDAPDTTRPSLLKPGNPQDGDVIT